MGFIKLGQNIGEKIIAELFSGSAVSNICRFQEIEPENRVAAKKVEGSRTCSSFAKWLRHEYWDRWGRLYPWANIKDFVCKSIVQMLQVIVLRTLTLDLDAAGEKVLAEAILSAKEVTQLWLCHRPSLLAST